jgi:hypothetical protein
MITGCSSATVSGSWKNPDYQGQLGKVYVVGVSKSEINRRIFESGFAEALTNYGVTVIPSYKDLPDAQNADIDQIAALMEKNRADSMLITRLVGTRTEEVITPGRISGYRSWTTGGFPYPYAPAPYYRHWGRYYNRCCTELVYEPPTVSQFEIATIEANLYSASSGELIWASQLESVVDRDLEKMIGDFIKAVTTDLHDNGLL